MCNIPSNFRWSFSSLSTYDQCPMCFKLKYIDHVKQDGNAFSDYGTFCHGLLERWAKGELPSFLMAAEYEDGYTDAITHSFPPFPRGMPEKYYQAGLEYFSNFEGFGDNYEILSAEKKFTLKFGEETFVGLADLVLRDKTTDEIIVIDHKSKSMSSMAKELNIYRRQLYTYAAYVKDEFGRFPSKLCFNMFKDGEWIEEEFDEAAYNETVQWITDTIKAIRAEKDWKVCTSGYFCRFVCSTFDDCPARDAILYPPPKTKEGET